MQRNIIQFDTTGDQLELVAEGTMWPREIVVDGEVWAMGQVVDVGSGFVIREYVHSGRAPKDRRRLSSRVGGG